MKFISSSAGEQHPTTPIAIPKDDLAAAYLRRRYRDVLHLVERGHSPLEHDFIFAYVDFLHSNATLKKEYEDPEVFRMQISLDIGHINLRRIRLKIDYLERLLKMARETGWVDLETPKSWSYARSHHDEFHYLVKRVSEWGFQKTGVDLKEFRRLHPRFKEA